MESKGKLILDDGGVKAIKTGKFSILAAGIIKVEGAFRAGDLVEVSGSRGRGIGRGKVSYSAEEVNRIKGQKSSEILVILNKRGPEEVIHRDYLVLY